MFLNCSKLLVAGLPQGAHVGCFDTIMDNKVSAACPDMHRALHQGLARQILAFSIQHDAPRCRPPPVNGRLTLDQVRHGNLRRRQLRPTMGNQMFAA